MTVYRFPRHKRYNCDGRCTGQSTCAFCEGGLFLCVVCAGAEGSLPTDCPGVKMPMDVSDAVYEGLVDYRAGAWRLPSGAVLVQPPPASLRCVEI